ncbi:TfoX/Sxy family protein [Paucibacter sp. Y2R2-4]|uniref:TfoX/Sxy family protein n=1 Tax=Paucibacter sp. Y2R2-4 TaxID=2893553 RepID=UPI0021E41242|nr:TfoX/Sxy family protein [Paucibacter sp. Y2R2-4]MCV2352367.1 TfoX/Sxy family protein [Paucibacter sp. Y2R2-4]
MAIKHELLDHSLELLSPLGALRHRRMFGGWGIYVNDLFIAIIAFDQLYLKADAQTREQFLAAGCTPFQYEREGQVATLGYFVAPEEAMESPALMESWGRLALSAALRARAEKAKPKAPKKKRLIAK